MKINKLGKVVDVFQTCLDMSAENSNGLCCSNLKDSTFVREQRDTIPFISMKKENLETYKDCIKKVGDDYIFLFDIDDTLYKSTDAFRQHQTKSFYEAFDNLRVLHLSKNKDIPESSIALKDNPLYIRSFLQYFDMTPSEVEDYREQCDYRDFIKRDEKLRDFLMNLPYRKWALTNGLRPRAEVILEAIGITECFEGVICCDDHTKKIIGKPMKKAFDFVENLLGIENRSKVIFFDDHHVSIQASNAIGWRGIQVKKEDDLIDLINELLKEIKN